MNLDIYICVGFPGGSDGKESACSSGDPGLIPQFAKIPWRRKWQPTPVFLPRRFHGQRSLAGYSPEGLKESDTIEWLTLLLLLQTYSIAQGTLLNALFLYGKRI